MYEYEKIPEFMRAIFLEDIGKLTLRKVKVPRPERGWVLLKVGACGICGSDVRYYLGENPWALHTLGINEPMPSNVVLGHEIAGTIVAVHDEEDRARLGNRVGVIAFNTCGKCRYCRLGYHNLCENTLHIGHDGRWKGVKFAPGGYADYLLLWSDKAHEIPATITFVEATQLDGLAVAVHAVNRGHVKMGDVVLIIGAGAIGQLIQQVSKVYGASKTIITDKRDLPLEVALKLGADVTVNSSKEDVIKEVLRNTKEGVDVVFDTVGTEESFLTGIKSLSRAGRLVLLAVTQTKVTIDLTMLAGERIITSSANNLFPEYTTAVELMASGKVKVRPFITHIFKLEEYKEAFKVALNKEEYDAIKVVLVP